MVSLEKGSARRNLTTTGQFGVDKLPKGVGLNTEAGFREYMSQVGNTVLQTFMQVRLMAGGTTGVSTAMRYMRQGQEEKPIRSQ